MAAAKGWTPQDIGVPPPTSSATRQDGNAVVSTLTVNFSEDGLADAGVERIVLEQTSTRFDFFGNLRARSNSRLTCKYTASTGTVTPTETHSIQINEGIKFSNSGRANLKFPNVTSVTIDTSRSLLMKKIKRYGRQQIVPATDLKVIYDNDLGVIRVGKTKGSLAGGDQEFVEVAVWGAVSVTYEAIFQYLSYTPSAKRYFNGGMELTLGSLFAYHDYDVAILDMKADMDNPKDWNEYCRVFSKIVLDPKGVWEFPPNWETTYQNNRNQMGEARSDMPGPGRWPSHNIAEVDPDNHFVDERTHLIIEVNSFGQLKTTYFHHSIEQPKVGHFNYDPTYHLRFSDPPGGERASSAEEFKYDLRNRTWRDVFLDVDKHRIIEKLEKEYRDIVVEQKRNNSP